MRVGLLIFDDVEEMDFVGPLEVFGVASNLTKRLEVTTISKNGEPIRCRHGLRVQPDHSFSNCSLVDVLIVPGGRGAREGAMHDPEILQFIRAQSLKAHIASVCTGALILAEAGLLDGHKATTHHEHIDALQRYTKIKVVTGVRYISEESVSSSAGISAGIDLALEILGRNFDEEVATKVRDEMEYSK
jgi:transcriptional regulator GlxA family with amidase domain